MLSSETVRAIRRLHGAPGADAAVARTIDAYASAYARPDDRGTALDILLRDLARLRTREPALDGLIAAAEGCVDALYRALARRAA